MSNKGKASLVPRLRFPGCEVEWCVRRLIDIVDNKKWSLTGGPFGSDLKSSDYTSNGVMVIQLQNIGDGVFIDANRIFTSEKKADELINCNIYPNEIIMSKMGDPVGRACIIPGIYARYLMCSDGIRLIINERKYVKYFIFSIINSYSFRKTLDNNSIGSTRKRIGLSTLKYLPLTVPNDILEQKKIAECLSSLDDLIAAEEKKLTALKIHKKGLLQKLFPTEGKTIPELRFPEYKDKGAWINKTLSECVYSSLEYGMNAAAIEYDGTNRYIRITDIDENSNEYISINPVSPKGELDIKYLVNENDILFTRTGASVGKTYLHKNKEGSYYFASFLIRAKLKSEYNPIFFFIQTQSSYYLKWVKLISTRSGQPGINSQEFSNYQFHITSKPEQQKIVDCLSSLDDHISAQSQKIEMHKTHKKGLMQGLFPSIGEV